ncbi:GbsR/MarR family transcriptional regulator [Saccharospirillum salsuginis]|uniref:HTH-type transcriptional regulator n=1 Tax=Saccharospirillum salsuginis TaxID=418750 RepID=A0A918N5V0_9GAMM|nr:GbsR/MarR family transcriptional regulator [Saccharospirillum salsuginis]GGX43386.1 transcriptional regulator [Saccharospirillum salsuginis]
MKLTPELESCVVHFGEMGSRWGFNRTVGQMLALIVLSDRPLSADEIAAALSVSRGNVSMATKELHSWHLIRTHREPGDRKDYLIANGSIWQLAQQVLSERKKREVDPTLSMLRSQLMELDDEETPPHALRQMREIHDLLELFNHWFDDVQNMKPEHLQALMKLGSGVGKVLEFTDRMRPKGKAL